MVQTQHTTQKIATGRRTMPSVLLHIEGAAVLAIATAAYFALGYTWWVFPLLLFVPDVSAIGYLFGPRAGSVTYNLAHTLVLPLVVLAGGWWLGSAVAIQLALIWLAHIGMDRMLGYGLKYPDSFKHNHLHEV